MRKYKVFILLIGLGFLASGLAGMKKTKIIERKLFDLPDDCFGEIFDYLGVKDFCDFRGVSKSAKYVVDEGYLKFFYSKRIIPVFYCKDTKKSADEFIKKNKTIRFKLIFRRNKTMKDSLQSSDLGNIPASNKLVEMDFSRLGGYINPFKVKWDDFPNLVRVHFGPSKVRAKTISLAGRCCKNIKSLRFDFGFEVNKSIYWRLINWKKFKNLKELEIGFGCFEAAHEKFWPSSDVLSEIGKECKNLKKLKIFIRGNAYESNAFEKVDWKFFENIESLHLGSAGKIDSEIVNAIGRSCKKLKILYLKELLTCNMGAFLRGYQGILDLSGVNWTLFENLSELSILSRYFNEKFFEKVESPFGDDFGNNLTKLELGAAHESKGFIGAGSLGNPLGYIKWNLFPNLVELTVVNACINKEKMKTIGENCKNLEVLGLISVGSFSIDDYIDIDWSYFTKLKDIFTENAYLHFTMDNYHSSRNYNSKRSEGWNCFNFAKASGKLKGVKVYVDNKWILS